MPRQKKNHASADASSAAVEERFRELGFWPSPAALVDLARQKVRSDVHKLVATSLQSPADILAIAQKQPLPEGGPEVEDGTKRGRHSTRAVEVEGHLRQANFWPCPPSILQGVSMWLEGLPKVVAAKTIPNLRSIGSLVAQMETHVPGRALGSSADPSSN